MLEVPRIATLSQRALAVFLALAVLVGGVGVASAAKAKTRCLRGEVVSMSLRAVTVRYKRGSKEVKTAMSLTQKQYDNALGRNVRRGSQVKVCSKDNFKRVAGFILQLKKAGHNIDEAPGGENAGPGAGGGGGGS